MVFSGWCNQSILECVRSGLNIAYVYDMYHMSCLQCLANYCYFILLVCASDLEKKKH